MNKLKKYLIILFVGVLCPLLITGILHHPQKKTELDEVEEMLPSVLATHLQEENEIEVMKALAVIERTRIKKALQDNTSVPQAISQEQLMTEWKSGEYANQYELMLECIEATYAQVITYEGEYIYPEYCYLCAGNTRDMNEAYNSEDFPYLKSQASKADIEANDYIQVFYYTKEEFHLICENQWGLKGETYEVTKTDSGEYVTSIVIDDKTLTGEEFREGMSLPSPAFSIKEIKGHVRVVTKGKGHGFGVSLYGANAMAKMGATYDSILKYYYSGVEIKTE